jgi:hypothetical protein
VSLPSISAPTPQCGHRRRSPFFSAVQGWMVVSAMANGYATVVPGLLKTGAGLQPCERSTKYR